MPKDDEHVNRYEIENKLVNNIIPCMCPMTIDYHILYVNVPAL